MDKLQLLEKHWGHSEFRPFQEQIINTVLEGEDVLAILPTGGGKSLCYQLPALLLEGTVLVISPLIALMEDQVKQLEKRGIKAMYFESHPKSLPLQQQIDNCIHGNYQLVFSAPERFLNPSFMEQLTRAKIGLIAIDEAHCISEWGHDFRPSYRKLDALRTHFPQVPLIALTASATPAVIKDMRTLLHLEKAKCFVDSFERSNIAYKIWNTEDKFNSLIQLLNYHKGSSIVYCNTRKQTEHLAELINQSGHSADFFHGGLLAEEKKQKLASWQKGSIPHMIATTAFGMGIDKADVRLVIHTQLPHSIENFYQETGRAGRDKKPASTYLLVHSGDARTLKSQFLDRIPSKNDIQETYKDLCNFLQIAYGEGKDELYSLDLNRFCQRYKKSLSMTEHTLRLFEQVGLFHLADSREKQLHVRVTASSNESTHYMSKGTASGQLLEYLIRQNPHLLTESSFLSPKKLCNALHCSQERLKEAFETLRQQGIVEFSLHESNIYVTPLTPREDQYTLRSAIEWAEKIYRIKKKKIQSIIRFVKDQDQCKRNGILTYFGEKKKDVCGQCSARSCKHTLEVENDFENKIQTLLKSAPHSLQEIKQKLYFEPQALRPYISQWLELEYIKENESQQYYWIHE
jgi:ATP-dependent DNA helicase RecQ